MPRSGSQTERNREGVEGGDAQQPDEPELRHTRDTRPAHPGSKLAHSMYPNASSCLDWSSDSRAASS